MQQRRLPEFQRTGDQRPPFVVRCIDAGAEGQQLLGHRRQRSIHRTPSAAMSPSHRRVESPLAGRIASLPPARAQPRADHGRITAERPNSSCSDVLSLGLTRRKSAPARPRRARRGQRRESDRAPAAAIRRSLVGNACSRNGYGDALDTALRRLAAEASRAAPGGRAAVVSAGRGGAPEPDECRPAAPRARAAGSRRRSRALGIRQSGPRPDEPALPRRSRENAAQARVFFASTFRCWRSG